MSTYITLFYMDVLTYPCPNIDAGVYNVRWWNPSDPF